MANEPHRVNDKRPLSREERALLEWLVAHGSPNASRYAGQIPRVTVVSHCGCGCPTIDLAVDDKQSSGASELIADVRGYSPEGISVGVIVHCREGLLSELEVYSTSGTDKPFSLPDLNTLVPFE